MNMSRSFAIGIVAFALTIAPLGASAQTSATSLASLQAQITQLLQMVQKLQAQLDAMRSGTTVTPSTASATIDPNSLTASSLTPTITGTASGTKYIGLTLGGQYGDKVYGSGSNAIRVVNGRWSVTIPANTITVAGQYTVRVYDNNGNVLATGTLVVNSTASRTKATLDQNNATVNSATGFTLSGTARTGTAMVSVAVVPKSYAGSTTHQALWNLAAAGHHGVVLNTSAVNQGHWEALFEGLTGDRFLPAGDYTVYVMDVSSCSPTANFCDDAIVNFTGTIHIISAQISASATIDQSSLNPSNSYFSRKNFTVTGTAGGVTKVLVDVELASASKSDLQSVVSDIRDHHDMRAGVFSVTNGNWAAAFSQDIPDWYAGQKFIVRVYDVSNLAITWARPGGTPDSEGFCTPSCAGVKPLAIGTLVVKK